MGKPTGGKNGRPKNAKSSQREFETFSEDDAGKEWSILSDLYEYYERGWHDENIVEMLKLREITMNPQDRALIESEIDKRLLQIKPNTDIILNVIDEQFHRADEEVLLVRFMIEEMTDKIVKSTDVAEQDRIISSYFNLFRKMRLSTNSEESKIMFSKLIGNMIGICGLVQIEEKVEMVRVSSEKKGRKPKIEMIETIGLKKLLTQKNLSSLYDNVSKLKPMEALFILDHIDKKADGDSLHVSLNYFEAFLRSKANYNPYKSLKDKRQFLNNGMNNKKSEYYYEQRSRVHYYTSDGKPENDTNFISDKEFKEHDKAERAEKKKERDALNGEVKEYTKEEIAEYIKKKTA